ncbi:MAG: hypothetical protein CM1200mP2_07870 [Planctomycetaceae bacterium]|nr:MAG: hypothetical protein CM1200mP2_07870 [Planctomycetaceae bacterium]
MPRNSGGGSGNSGKSGSGGENGGGEGEDEGAKVAETQILTVVGQRESGLPKVGGGE